MALSFRKFNAGHGSELLYNDEVGLTYAATKHLLDNPDNDHAMGAAEVNGALWLNTKKNELNAFDKSEGKWKNIFSNKFQIVDQITDAIKPTSPVRGQLWIYNDMIYFFDGSQWKPTKAIAQDSSQFDLSIFENYIIASPLWKQGNTVVMDGDIDEFMKVRREYLQGKIDTLSDSAFSGDGTKWEPGKNMQPTPPDLSTLKLDGSCQFLIPNIANARLFMNDKLDYTYKLDNQITIRYDKQYLLDKVPSMTHLNPSKLTKITKRLFKIDRQNPRIPIGQSNTEFYGFRSGDRNGHFLFPESDQNTTGYALDNVDGIILSYNQAQNYDYVLAISFEFSDVNPNGKFYHLSNQQESYSYYLENFSGTNSVFVEGLAMEGLGYREDSLSKTVTMKEDTSELEVQMLHTSQREYGFVRDVTLNNTAIFHVIHEFKNPLVFMNGEAMNASIGDFVYDRTTNTFEVKEGRMNMAWVVVDLYDREHCAMTDDGKYISVTGEKTDANGHPYNADGTINPALSLELKGYDMLESCGVVSETDEYGAGRISYTTNDFAIDPDTKLPEHIALFVDGMIIRQQEITLDIVNKKITTKNLKPGQDYILLKDRYNYLVNDSKFMPAMEVNKLSESLVYVNGYLITNESAIAEENEPQQVSKQCDQNEIRRFLNPAVTCEFQMYDKQHDKWVELSTDESKGLKTMLLSYDNTPRTIKFNFDISKKTDFVDVYAYNYATDIQNVLIIKNLPAELDDPAAALDDKNTPLREVASGDAVETAPNGIHYYEKDVQNAILTISREGKSPEKIRAEAIEKLSILPKYTKVYYHKFTIDNSYPTGIGALSVWVNGVRQYNILEIDQYNFGIQWPVKGMVTYTIEYPEDGYSYICRSEVLDNTNAVKNTVNVYRSGISLYPGRPVVYIDGVRQPEESYSILDEHTIMFRDTTTRLVGNKFNYPDETAINENNEPVTLHHTMDDKILIEIHPEFKWQEEHTTLEQKSNNFVISALTHNLDERMLRSGDELRIYIDGLFFGLKDYDGYRKDVLKRSVIIERSDIIDRLSSNPLYKYLMETEGAMLKYKAYKNEQYIAQTIRDAAKEGQVLTRDEAIEKLKLSGKYDKDYTPDIKDVIIEWR